jgi:peptidoglycan/LPS O-acetylase OafA/YrhL
MLEKMAHVPRLNGLRGLAVILVLLAHSTIVFVRIPPFTGWMDRSDSLGAQIFFVLSGFLITRILIETKESTRYFTSFFIWRDRGSLVQAIFVIALQYSFVIGVASPSFFLFERPFLRLKQASPADCAGTSEGKAHGWWPPRMRANAPGCNTAIPARMARRDVTLAGQGES